MELLEHLKRMYSQEGDNLIEKLAFFCGRKDAGLLI